MKAWTTLKTWTRMWQFCHEFNSKSNNSNMHARIMFYFNMYELKQDLAPQFDMNHARTSSIHKQEGNYSTLGLECKMNKLNYAILCSKSFNFRAILQVNSRLSLPLSLNSAECSNKAEEMF